MLLPIGIVSGLIVLLLHWLGARGTIIPGTPAPKGGGWYSKIWPLDTFNHFLAGVSIASLSVVLLDPFTGKYTLEIVAGLLPGLAVLWEIYEILFWNEIDSSGTKRRWAEDTQADVLAVLLGGYIVLVAVIFGAL